MWMTALSVLLAGWLANAFRAIWPVEVTVQLAVFASNQPETVAVPPSIEKTIGSHVLPSRGKSLGFAGGLAQSAG